MKIMWVTNIIFPEQANALGYSFGNYGGWVYQFKKAIEESDNKLLICNFSSSIKTKKHTDNKSTNFVLLPKKNKSNFKKDTSLQKLIEEQIDDFAPDIIHCWGSEYYHTLATVNAAASRNIPHVISIQGPISDYARHYYSGISLKNIISFSLRDLLRMDNIFFQKVKFAIRGSFEIEALKKSRYVIGRTDYDKSIVFKINPKIKYYFCNECLRDDFYNSKWDDKNVLENSIFISQCNYPIKGFHYFLDALSIVRDEIPSIKVYVAGDTHLADKNCKNKIRYTSYEQMIMRKINKLKIDSNINFLGSLSANDMKKQLLRSNLFVSPSNIENSPNSVGEAMILGVPLISSYVGGVSNMVEHKKDGYTYPHNQPSLLAQYIIELLNDKNLARDLSKNAIKSGEKIFCIEKNTKELLSIYQSILANHSL